MRFYVSVSPITISKKPVTRKEIAKISSSIEVKQVTLKELVECCTEPNSFTVSPGVFKNNNRVKKDWLEQQVIMLDFDCGINPTSLIERLQEYNLQPNFYYFTKSHSEEKPKFRLVFVLDLPFKNKIDFTNVLKAFQYLFPEVDKNCLELSRMFYPGSTAEIISEDFLPQTKLLDILNPFIISNDNQKMRKIVSKRVSVLNNNSNTCFQTNNVQNDYFNYLKSLKENNVDFNEIYSKVRIFRDFVDGKWLYHDVLFGIVTNLIWLKGGSKFFINTIKENNRKGLTNYGDDKIALITYIKNQGYFPQKLSNFSPYAEDHLLTNLHCSIRQPKCRIEIINTPQLVSLEDGCERFNKEIKEALSAENNKIYVFKVPTGLGKTELLTNLEGVTLAFPTHQLKEEVSTRMKVECDVLPEKPIFKNISVNHRIDILYQLGLKNEVNRTIKKISLNSDEQHDIADVIAANEYIKQLELIRESQNSILITHSRALDQNWNNGTLIFDEDPIQSVLEISSLSLLDLVSFNIYYANKSIDAFIAEIMNQTAGVIGKVPKFKEIDSEFFTEAILTRNVSTNLSVLLNASHYLLDKKDRNKIYCVQKRNLPENKAIILSASPQVHLYEQMLGDRIKFIDLSNIRIRGKIFIDNEKSYSRSSLSKLNQQDLLKKIGNDPVITFKTHKNMFKGGIENMHFGNVNGYDELKGNNISVVGTPHFNESVYLLFAAASGIEIGKSNPMKKMKLEYNGFRFSMLSFDDPHLQRIQCQMIESELTQAIGRARALREDCTVKVFSNFPILQAELKHQILE